MNKSKLKFFIGSILTLNCLITIEKVYAAMKKSPSPPRMSQSNTWRSSLGSGASKKYESSLKTKSLALDGLQNLTQEEVRPIIGSAKKLVNDGKFLMSDILEQSLRFIGKGKEDIKLAFEILDETHYKKSFEDYKRKGKNFYYNGTVYFFEKNTPEDDRKIYAKFSLGKDNKNLRIKTFSDSAIEIDGVDSSQDISKILNNSEYIKNDFAGRVVDKAISILQSKIESKDYHILDRAKYGLEQLGYTQADFKNIIDSLTKKNYITGPNPVQSDKDNKGHIQYGDLFVFGYKDPKTQKESYIKFVMNAGTDDVLFLSFHESDNDLKYFFQELQ